MSPDGMFHPGYERMFSDACRSRYNSLRRKWKDLKKSPAEIAAKKTSSTKRSRKARVTFFFKKKKNPKTKLTYYFIEIC